MYSGDDYRQQRSQRVATILKLYSKAYGLENVIRRWFIDLGFGNECQSERLNDYIKNTVQETARGENQIEQNLISE